MFHFYLSVTKRWRQALGSVYEETMPFLRKTVDLGCKVVDAGAGGRGMDAFKRLAGDFGVLLFEMFRETTSASIM